MFEGIKVNGTGRKVYTKERTPLYGDLDTLSFVRVSRLNWIGPVNVMDSERNVSQVFSKNVQGSILTLRRLMSYIYGAPILDVSRSHTTTQHSR